MRIATVSTTILLAGMIALPALAQGQLPRPGAQTAEKGLPPGPAQKGAPAPQQQAEPAPVPPAPYTPLAVAPPKPFTDPTLATFRKDLAAVAQKKDRAALTKMVLAKEFFWLKEDGNAAGKKSGIEVLSTALNLAAKDGSGWEVLAELTNDETAAPYPDRPNTVCSPAGPDFKPEDFDKMVESTKVDPGDWGFTAGEVEVHATADMKSPVIEKIGMIFVRVMPDTAPNASQEAMRIVTPAGKVGFVPSEAVNPLGSDQICYGKDAAGAWKIVGMIGGE